MSPTLKLASSQWLLELSVLVRILYQGILESDRDLVTRDEDGVVTYSEEWM